TFESRIRYRCGRVAAVAEDSRSCWSFSSGRAFTSETVASDFCLESQHRSANIGRQDDANTLSHPECAAPDCARLVGPATHDRRAKRPPELQCDLFGHLSHMTAMQRREACRAWTMLCPPHPRADQLRDHSCARAIEVDGVRGELQPTRPSDRIET